MIVAAQGPDSTLADALGDDMKGKISPVLYAVAIPLAFVSRWVALGIYVLVALIWLVPDRRIESRIQGDVAARRRSARERDRDPDARRRKQ